jgi:hypothetical protein
VIVNELYVVGCPIGPAKNHPPLLVGTSAVETPPVAPKPLEAVARGRPKIEKRPRGIEHIELAWGSWHNVGWKGPRSATPNPVIEIRGRLVAERRDHGSSS